VCHFIVRDTLWHKLRKNQHVITHPAGGWQVKGVGNAKATKRTATQAETHAAARHIAINQKSEVLIHGRNGQIRAKASYGNAPHPSKG